LSGVSGFFWTALLVCLGVSIYYLLTDLVSFWADFFPLGPTVETERELRPLFLSTTTVFEWLTAMLTCALMLEFRSGVFERCIGIGVGLADCRFEAFRDLLLNTKCSFGLLGSVMATNAVLRTEELLLS